MTLIGLFNDFFQGFDYFDNTVLLLVATLFVLSGWTLYGAEILKNERLSNQTNNANTSNYVTRTEFYEFSERMTHYVGEPNTAPISEIDNTVYPSIQQTNTGQINRFRAQQELKLQQEKNLNLKLRETLENLHNS
ncbi:hypothetical protein BKY29_10210 [Weissella confusa]|uniref:hypothetical protein n=1 Tax=Weissella confusa TaxID=1583 RepID=UPI0008FDF5D9|nr:hypothetical protein [Weissella confusa]OJF02761.1 hypothetical protein BKY29_10210 [Weissella confusa]